MSTRAESNGGFWDTCAKKLLPGSGPLYDADLIKEFHASDPHHGNTLIASMSSRRLFETFTGYIVGVLSLLPLTPLRLRDKISRLTRQGYSHNHSLVRVFVGPMMVCNVGFFVGAYAASHWYTLSGKNPQEAEAKFHDWLQKRASAES